MAVCFTNKNIHVQFIDDTSGVTLAAASTGRQSNAPAARTGRECGERQNSWAGRGPHKRLLAKALSTVVL